jgi:hypothetical protein
VITYNRERPFRRELLEHAAEPKVIADYVVFRLRQRRTLSFWQGRIVKENSMPISLDYLSDDVLRFGCGLLKVAVRTRNRATACGL